MIQSKDIYIGMLCASGSEALYGLSYLFTKRATQVLRPFALLGWRFLLAAAIMGLLMAFGLPVRLRGRSLKPLFALALFSPCLYFTAETLGIHSTTATESGVMLACIPVASVIAAALLLGKRPSGRQVTGIAVTLAGVSLSVCAVGLSSSLSIGGYLWLLIAVVSYALYSVKVDQASDFSGIEITAAMLFAGAGVFTCLALCDAVATGTMYNLLLLPFVDRSVFLAILFQGLGCSIAAFFLANRAIALIGVSRTASFIGVSTVVALLAGALVLREPFSVLQIIGALIILLGITIANTQLA